MIIKLFIKKCLGLNLTKLYHLSNKKMNWVCYKSLPIRNNIVCEAYTLREILYKVLYELN